MLLCIDVGNTHIHGGIYDSEKLSFQFRYPSKTFCTSDELGIFLKNYLREMEIEPNRIHQVAVCSVVPSLDYSIRSAFIKYFALEPFILQAGVKTGLQIKCKNPLEVGTDRIANAIAAIHQFPQKNIIVVDLGTATTVEIITSNSVFLGGAILPGLQMQMRALNENTAKLPPVPIVKAHTALGQCTLSSIQSGLYYGHKGAIKEMLSTITAEVFHETAPIIIGTGGFAHLFEQDNLFNVLCSDLVLQGLRVAYYKNN